MGTDVGVPQHLLDHAQVRAVFEQMAREGVAERVRVDVLGDPGDARGFLHDHPDAFAPRSRTSTDSVCH